MKLLILGISALFILIFAPELGATENSAATVYIQGTQPVSDFDHFPRSLQKKHLHAPFLFGVDYLVGGGQTKFFGDIHAAALGYTSAPAFGLALGPVMKIGIADLKIVGEMETNGTLDSETADSHLKAWRFGLKGKLSVQSGILLPSVALRWISMTTVQIANMENLPTKVAHAGTYVFTPGLLVRLPFVLAEASLGIYSFGKTAVTSKEFAYSIARQTVFRPTIGAGFDLPGIELWLRAFAVYPHRGDDPIEYLYMAPMYVNDNMMTKQAVTVEARFHL